MVRDPKTPVFQFVPIVLVLELMSPLKLKKFNLKFSLFVKFASFLNLNSVNLVKILDII